MDVPFQPISPQSLSQRSPMVMLPALIGSPSHRGDPHSNNHSHNHHHNINNNSNKNYNNHNGSNGVEKNTTPACYIPSHGRGGPHTVSAAAVAAAAAATAAAAVTAAGGGGGSEACAPPTSLQIGSSWSEGYTVSTTNVTTSSCRGVHEVGGDVVPAAPSPAGPVSVTSGGGGGVAIVDFSPTWDFAPGGAKLLICLATPVGADSGSGSVGPVVFFADRPVQVRLLFIFNVKIGLMYCFFFFCVALEYRYSAILTRDLSPFGILDV